MTTPDLLAALGRARAALAAVNGTTDGAAVIPSAGATDVIDELARYGTVDALDADVAARQLVLPVRLRALLDWNGKAANKPAVRTAAASLVARDDAGRSRYPVAVEALSYAAACGAYLQPDQLTALIDHCTAAPWAYAPVTRIAQLSRDLGALLGHYPTRRQHTLLCSLWDAAHDPDQGRWWEHCGGRGIPDARLRRHRRADDHEQRAARLQADAGIGEAPDCELDGDPVAAVMAGELGFTAEVAERLRTVDLATLPSARAAAFTEWATLGHDDPDLGVLAAQVPALTPRQRPESPLVRMVEAAVLAWTGPDGALLVDQMPDKPTGWDDLFPAVSMTGYPIPPAIMALDGLRVDPPAGVTDDAFVVDLCRNDNELQANGDYMGNCTYRFYASRCRDGDRVIGRIYHRRETYNFALDHTGGDRWRLAEMNGYQNQGHRVPGWVRQWATDTALRLRAMPLQADGQAAA